MPALPTNRPLHPIETLLAKLLPDWDFGLGALDEPFDYGSWTYQDTQMIWSTLMDTVTRTQKPTLWTYVATCSANQPFNIRLKQAYSACFAERPFAEYLISIILPETSTVEIESFNLVGSERDENYVTVVNFSPAVKVDGNGTIDPNGEYQYTVFGRVFEDHTAVTNNFRTSVAAWTSKRIRPSIPMRVIVLRVFVASIFDSISASVPDVFILGDKQGGTPLSNSLSATASHPTLLKVGGCSEYRNSLDIEWTLTESAQVIWTVMRLR